VHPNPAAALCDGPQALLTEVLAELTASMTALAPIAGRTMTPPPV